jgi:hypothetical protein
MPNQAAHGLLVIVYLNSGYSLDNKYKKQKIHRLGLITQ